MTGRDLETSYDAIVIGSGMSGLSAANILAKSKMRVLLVEQHHRFGGYLQSFVLHRTPFDSGCHYVGALGRGQVFDRYLRYLGVRDRIHAVPLDPEGYDVLSYPDWSFEIPVGYERLEGRLARTFPDEADGARRFLREMRDEVERFPMYALRESQAPEGRTPDPFRSVANVLDASGIRNTRVREILTAYRALYFVHPAEAPFSMHAFTWDSFLQGAYAIRGGGHALVKALLTVFRERGGRAIRRTRVVGVDVEDRTVCGIRTARGERVRAPLVVACIDPKVAVSLLPEDAVRPVFRKRVEKLQSGIGGLGAYLRVDADLSRFAHANHWLRNTDDEDDPLFSERWLTDGSAPPVFVTVPSAREPNWRGPHVVVALSGLRAVHFAKWSDTSTGDRPKDYHRFKNELGQRMVEPVRKLIPEIDTHLVSADFSTPLTHLDFTLNGGGAIYGIHHSVAQSGARGVSWRTRVDGFLLAGHSVLYPGLIGATISAFYACGEVVGLAELHREILRS